MRAEATMAAVAVVAVLGLAGLMVVTAPVPEVPELHPEPGHYPIIEIPTPREGVVCFALLDAQLTPTQLSCTYTGEPSDATAARARGQAAPRLLY